MRFLYQYWDSNDWCKYLLDIKYLQDHRKPFNSCKPNEERPHIALPCYNEIEKELFMFMSNG